MDKEIKEILDKWKCYIGLTKKFTTNEYEMLRVEDIDKILDYITNLQEELEEEKRIEEADLKTIQRLEEENERLKEENINIKNYIVLRNVDSVVQDKATLYNIELENINKKKYLDYKSRCEKASEYFKYQLENLDFYEDTKARMLCAMGITLLQNGSDSQ